MVAPSAGYSLAKKKESFESIVHSLDTAKYVLELEKVLLSESTLTTDHLYKSLLHHNLSGTLLLQKQLQVLVL